MRLLPVLGAVVLLAVMANAARPCENNNLVGLRFIAFPVGIPTPGGHTAAGLYVDDRDVACPIGPTGCIGFPGINPLNSDGTWLYLETNGVAGLQRGGHSSLPTTPLTGENDPEFAACSVPDPDELVF